MDELEEDLDQGAPHRPDDLRRRGNAVFEWLFRLCEVMLLTALFSLAAKQTGDLLLQAFSAVLLLGTMWHALNPLPKIVAQLFVRHEEPEGIELWVLFAFVGISMLGLGGAGIYALQVALRQLLSSGLIH